jgi:hypothetical protein
VRATAIAQARPMPLAAAVTRAVRFASTLGITGPFWLEAIDIEV